MSQLKMQAMALGGGAGTVALKELAVSPGKSSKLLSIIQSMRSSAFMTAIVALSIETLAIILFLVACTQLYSSLCWSVCRSVGLSVYLSVINSVFLYFFCTISTVFR